MKPFVLSTAQRLLLLSTIFSLHTSIAAWTVHQQNKIFKSAFQEPNPKYYSESGPHGHYYAPFFKEELDDTTRYTLMKPLVRSYLTAMRKKLGVDTWLAHGTLLGWWWNGQIMPWDTDLDVQLMVESLKFLSRHFNHTRFHYNITDGELAILPAKHDATRTPFTAQAKGKEDGLQDGQTRTYLLDINPYSIERSPRDWQNVIDARWVDVQTGLFIDMTGLAEDEPLYRPGTWSCKKEHRYGTNVLYPLRESDFMGVPALVPNDFELILREEYGQQCMTETVWEGYQFSYHQKQWLKLREQIW